MAYHSILCPIDFSETSRRALEYALALGGRDRATLTVLTVVERLLVEAAAAVYDKAYLERETDAELQKFVRASLPPSSGLNVRLQVRVGAPDEEILTFAQEARVDLIVMGTHGLSGYQKMFFGSVTENVLRHPPSSLLAVPPTAAALKSTAAGPRWSVERLMAPVELADDSEENTLREAGKTAADFGAALLIVHVVPRLGVAAVWTEPVESYHETRVAAARTRLEGLRRTLPAKLPVETRVLVGQPSDEIVNLATSERVGLIVMGLKSDAGVLDAQPGSIAYRVLQLAQVPVLVCP